ncbi:MAG: DNA-directed RNA polymerase subunit omega [Acutalibacteraceae bacterium]|nr:DNA-directed RNA polymerase subunit omega [Clostridia bacterium]MEE1143797.1 DNA-directed RNA polymerase subunit omega [Acutalibacteraceae bacterium]
MLNPSIGKLIGIYESRYQLVLDVAKYARYISEQADEKGEILVEKPVNVALNKLASKYDNNK